MVDCPTADILTVSRANRASHAAAMFVVDGHRELGPRSYLLSPRSACVGIGNGWAVTLATLGPGAQYFGDVARALGRNAREISSARATLAKKGVISAPVPGRIEFRIPFTDRFLREHEADYRTPEVLAALEKISRVAPE